MTYDVYGWPQFLFQLTSEFKFLLGIIPPWLEKILKCAPLKSVKLHSNYEEKYAVQEVDLTKSFTETFHLMTRYLLFVKTCSN